MGSWPGVRPVERPAGRPARQSWAAPVSSAAPKKKHLIEAAPFGRLDQIHWPAVNETKRKKQKTKRTLLKKDFLSVVL